jgi:hypothetical protein
VLTAIESGVGPETASKAPAAEADTARAVPLFGQILMDGEVHTVQPEGVTANAVMLAGAGLSSAAALKALRDIAPAGSAAERLFRRGEAAAAPAGRSDDFSAAPEE